MSDQTTTLADLREIMRQFVHERDWNQFHSPKNLSMAIAIEAAELMEHFQWQDVNAARDIHESPEDMQQVREELADIVAYVVSFANSLNIDISTALREKMIKNAKKYPAADFQGRFRR